MLWVSEVPSPGTLGAWWKLSASPIDRSSPLGASVLLILLRSFSIYTWAVRLMIVKSNLLGTISVSRILTAVQLRTRKSRILFVYRAMNEETSSERLNDSPPSHTCGGGRVLGCWDCNCSSRPVQGTELRSRNSIMYKEALGALCVGRGDAFK